MLGGLFFRLVTAHWQMDWKGLIYDKPHSLNLLPQYVTSVKSVTVSQHLLFLPDREHTLQLFCKHGILFLIVMEEGFNF